MSTDEANAPDDDDPNKDQAALISSSSRRTKQPSAQQEANNNDEKLLLQLKDQEEKARKHAHHNIIYLTVVNTYAAFYVFVFYLLTLESWIGIGLSVGFTIYAYNVTLSEINNFDGTVMNWILLSFAALTPISAAVRFAFGRRELALQQMAILRSTFLELYTAHCLWDWGSGSSSGRQKSTIDWLEHSDQVSNVILAVCEKLTRLLTLPNTTRARHRITRLGRKEAVETFNVGAQLEASIMADFGRLAQLCEVLKQEGLPPNEATRIRQWERMLLQAIEQLRVIKLYRTPQGLRSFARLFSMFLPPLYAPYYASMAHDLQSLAMAIVFSILTSIALTALFSTTYTLEDPFLPSSFLDGINVQNDLLDEFKPQLRMLRTTFFPNVIKPDDGKEANDQKNY